MSVWGVTALFVVGWCVMAGGLLGVLWLVDRSDRRRTADDGRD